MKGDLVLRNTIYGGLLLSLITPLIVSQSLFFPFVTGKNFFFRIITAVVFGLWIVLAARNKEYRLTPSMLTWIFGGLLISLGISALLGPNTTKSIWSNFERMEGWVTLLHLFAYFSVLVSVIKTQKLWEIFWNTSIGISTILSLYALLQIAGALEIHQGSTRVDASFGNAAYLAIYMLFHVGIAGFLFMRKYLSTTNSRSTIILWVYGFSIVLNTYVLFMTATRGAILGLIGGAGLTLLLIALFEKEYIQLRKKALSGIAVLIVCIGLFFGFKNTAIVQETLPLKRLADISLTDSTTQSRFIIWGMAMKGVAEKPLFGWGQESFNYVFNKNYDPRMYAQEQWFDRAHNVLFDWLVSGGVIGFLLYIGLFISALYYMWRKREGIQWGVAEKSVVTGMLAGYVIHNLFVFDNIVSYMLFVLTLGYIYVSNQDVSSDRKETRLQPWNTIVAPIVAIVVTALSIFFFNVRGMQASGMLIDALKSISLKQYDQALVDFDVALEHESFATQEMREQLSQISTNVVASDLPQETKDAYFNRAVEELNKQIKSDPNNARIRVFLGALYGRNEMYAEAISTLEEALILTPDKQNILLEIGTNYTSLNKDKEALARFKKAFELDESFELARFAYAMGAIYTGDDHILEDLLVPVYGTTVVPNTLLIKAYFDTGQLVKVVELWNAYIELEPQNPQHRFSLAAAYLDAGMRSRAIEVLVQAQKDFTQFSDQIQFYINEVSAGRNP